MRDKKRRAETFSVYDRTGLERHLAEMAQKGWLLEKIGQFLWTYRRIEPKALTFCVCYFPKASAFDPQPSEEQETFYDFCAHTGWTLAASSAQLQVFCNEREDPVPIETDPALEVEAIHRSVKRGLLPSKAVLLAVALLNAALFLWRVREDPISTLSSSANLFTGFCWLILIVLTGTDLAGYFRWHRRAVLAAQRGEFLETGSHRLLQAAAMFLVILGLGVYFLTIAASGNRTMALAVILMFCVYIPGLFLTVNGVKDLLKQKKVSAGINRAVTFASAFAASYAILGVILFAILFGQTRGWFTGDGESYTYRGQTFTVYQDALPLTVEDLTQGADPAAADRTGYTRRWEVEQSPLLAQFTGRQRPRFDAEDYKQMPRLEYTVTEVKAPFLYGLCKNSLLHDRDDWYEDLPEELRESYVPIDAAPWGAGEAYQWSTPEGRSGHFLLCYPARMVEITFTPGWTLTPGQMALVGERLGK